MTNFSVENEKEREVNVPKNAKNTAKAKLKINYCPNITITEHLCTSFQIT